MTILGMLIPFVATGLVMAVAALAWGYYKDQDEESWAGVDASDTDTGGHR